MRTLETDYLVVGAGAMGMAFTDALVDHADVHVTLVDRRHAAGGHWQDAYPFVQLHQASLFYGVASTVLGSGAVQQGGPEAGLHERARKSEILAYYDDILSRRFVGTGQVRFLGATDYHADGSTHLVTSRVSGETAQVKVRCRVVDATYLSPTIPATTQPPFRVADDVRVVPVNKLADLATAPRHFVIVGSGKTATDAIVWLLTNGVQPDRIMWIRPRDPWMLDRVVVQPDPVVALGLSTAIMAAAADADSPDDLFLRLEAAGVMLRLDRDVLPTMAKTPTLGTWELDLLRTVENVVRMGHIRHMTSREILFAEGSMPLERDSVVVHCAASGIRYQHLFPSGGLTPSDSRPSESGSRASAPPSPATWRRRETTTASAIDSVRPATSRTSPLIGQRWWFAGRSMRAPSALSQTSRHGPMTAHSTLRASSHRAGTIPQCGPQAIVWLPSLIVGSIGWPNSRECRSRGTYGTRIIGRPGFRINTAQSGETRPDARPQHLSCRRVGHCLAISWPCAR